MCINVKNDLDNGLISTNVTNNNNVTNNLDNELIPTNVGYVGVKSQTKDLVQGN